MNQHGNRTCAVRSDEQGSVILAALVFGAVLITILASLSRWVLNEYRLSHRAMTSEKTFHVAEYGIERALFALQYGELDGVDWVQTNLENWHFEQHIEVGGEVTNVQVWVEMTEPERFSITSVASTPFQGHPVGRAILVHAHMIQDPALGRRYFLPDFLFKDKVVFGMSTGGPSAAVSCDSSLYSEPDFRPHGSQGNNSGNTGYDVVLASLLDDPEAILLTNTWIFGNLGVGGNTPPLYDRDGNKGQGDIRARLQGADTPNGVLFDSDQIIQNFDLDLPVPHYPDPTEYDSVQNFEAGVWSGKSQIVLGQPNQRSYIAASEAFDPSGGTEIVIQGEVVLFVDGPIHTDGDITFSMNGEQASLIIVPASEVEMLGEVTVQSRYPSQMLILQPQDHGDITISTQDFRGFINAPESNITLLASAKARGTKKNLFWGGIVGRSFQHKNAFLLASDPSARNRNQSAATATGRVAVIEGWFEIVPPQS